MNCPSCKTQIPDEARFCGACGASFTEPAKPAVGVDALVGKDVAGRYRIVKKLGQGGMGTVFRAEQISLKRGIALKVLDPNLFHDKELVRRFHTEAELAAKLSHPHTVTLYDFGESDGMLYIAMELLEGRSLRDELSAGPLPPARVVDIAEQVASSLADAHGHGIVHRDLKPDNVMLQERAGRKDFVRVLDFGIAKLRDERNAGQSMMQQTAAGQLLGTPQYMAPEQVMGDTVDGRTDVYALGVVMYEMAAGRPPFEAANIMQMLAMHLHDAPPPPEQKRPGLSLPPGLTSLIMRCLAKKREARPANMQAVQQELAALRGAVGLSAAAPTMNAPQATPPRLNTPVPTPFGAPPGVGPQLTPHGAPVPMTHARPHPMGQPMGGQPMTPPRPMGPPTPMMGPPTPMHGPPTPMHMGQAPAHTPHFPRPPFAQLPYGAAPRKASLLWLWILLGVLGVGGLIAVVVVKAASQVDEDRARAIEELEEMRRMEELRRELEKLDVGEPGVPGMPAPPSAPQLGGFGDPGAAPAKYVASGMGFWVEAPAGMMIAEESPGNAAGFGVIDGRAAMITIEATRVDTSEMTLAMLAEAAETVPSHLGGRVIEKRHRRIGGEQHPSVIFDTDATGFRGEVVLYARDGKVVGVLFAIEKSGFDATAALRERLFTQGVGFE